MKRSSWVLIAGILVMLVTCSAAVKTKQVKTLSSFAVMCRSAPAGSVREALSSGVKMDYEAWFEAAFRNPDVKVLQVLLDEAAKSGVNLINLRDSGGWTALMLAVKSNPNVEVTRFLIDAGADVNAKNKMITALTIAQVSAEKKIPGRRQIIEILIKAGAMN